MIDKTLEGLQLVMDNVLSHYTNIIEYIMENQWRNVSAMSRELYLSDRLYQSIPIVCYRIIVCAFNYNAVW